MGWGSGRGREVVVGVRAHGERFGEREEGGEGCVGGLVGGGEGLKRESSVVVSVVVSDSGVGAGASSLGARYSF